METASRFPLRMDPGVRLGPGAAHGFQWGLQAREPPASRLGGGQSPVGGLTLPEVMIFSSLT